MLKNTFDEGFSLELVKEAFFDGELEIPKIASPKEIIIPTAMIPFSKRNRSEDFSECLVFYEHDINFAEVVRNPEAFIKDFLRFQAMVTPDNSLYRDAPLLVQIANVYRSRAVGHVFQKSGAYVIPNVRWGDERSYTTSVLPEKFAFLGVPKNSIVSIGTYGCIRGKENQYQFREGLEAMLDELTPEVVLVYGNMPQKVFDGIKSKTNFVDYPDWISKGKRTQRQRFRSRSFNRRAFYKTYEEKRPTSFEKRRTRRKRTALT